MAKQKFRIKDIAKQAGVSAGTVDRVLHNRGEVAEATREKILNIVKEHNYHPNLIARALTSKKHCVFASLLPTATSQDSFWVRPLQGILKAVDELEQFQIELEQYFFDQFDVEDFKNKANEILLLCPEGVILSPFFKNESLAFTRQLEEKGIPYVYVDSYIEETNFLAFVGEDGFQGGRVAAHLIDHGLDSSNDILIINMAKEIENVHHLNQRNLGFLSYFNDHGKNKGLKINLEIPSTNYKTITERLDDILGHNTNIRAIFVTGSRACLIAQYLKQRNLTHIILVGYDPLEDNVTYLSDGVIDFLIGQRPFQQGSLGIRKLFDHVMQQIKVEQIEFLPIDIISRENIKLYQPR